MKVKMINSVDEHVAGTEIELPDELADLFIIKGYAEGQLSRDYDESERAEILELHQAVNLGG
jgi:hypothetical protein